MTRRNKRPIELRQRKHGDIFLLCPQGVVLVRLPNELKGNADQMIRHKAVEMMAQI